MSENQVQIKVNNLEELLAKAREYVDSQGGADKVRVGNISSNSGYYTYTKNGLVQTSKGTIELELKGQNGSSVEFFLEIEREKEELRKISKIPKKFFKELNKIIPDAWVEPSKNKIPDKENNFQPHSLNVRAIPCSSMEEVKKGIKEFYQKYQVEINKNPDFDQWIEITEMGLFSNYLEVGKNGETITSGPHNTATISLKGADQNENGKVVNERTNLVLKVKVSEEWGDSTIDWPEKELKIYWNSLINKRESKNTSPLSPSEKTAENEIEQLRQEIKDLEKNSSQNGNSSEKQKELEEKKKRLRELEKEGNNATSTNNNDKLLVCVSVGGIILLIGGFFLVLAVRKKRKNK